MQVRRVVTGHTKEGKAVIVTDESIAPIPIGARGSAILMNVMRQGLALTTAGLVLGMLLATAIVRSLEANIADLAGMAAVSAPSLAVVGSFMVLTALLACYVPARRATTVDPAVVLRDE